jgi:hypothetical protein
MDAKTKNKLRKNLRNAKQKLERYQKHHASNPKAAYADWIERKDLRKEVEELTKKLRKELKS